MHTFSEPLSASETTGELNPDNEHASETGRQLGETGSAAMPTSCDRATKEIARPRGSWEVAVHNAKSSKTWHKLPLRSFIDGDYVRPSELNARQAGWQAEVHKSFPPSLSEAQAAEVVVALREAREAMKPAGPEAVATQLLRLAAVLAMADRAATETMIEVYVEDLEHVPADLLADACRQWRRRERFFPTISELLALVDGPLTERRSRLFVLAELNSIAHNPAPDETVTDEWCEARWKDGKREAQALLIT